MRFNLLPGAKSTRLRRGLVVGAALALTSGTVVAVANQAMAASGCQVTYTTNDWPGGFTANVAITNLGDSLSSWSLEFDFPNSSQQITQAWNSTYTQSGQHVTLSNTAWNGSLGTNATTTPGFNGSWSGSNPAPTSFTLNGVACTGSTTDPTSDPTTDPTTDPTGDPNVDHVDNPYASGQGYINPEWKAKAEAESGGSRVSDNPTAVWIDRIAAIEGTDDSSSNGSMGVRDHLDEAVSQGAAYIQFVIYDLPGRDCAALASNGELGPEEIGRYQTEYIDPIAAIMADSAYADLQIINIIEIDSLPNLITNTGDRETATDACDVMLANGNYVAGVQYALNKLHAIGNVYNYVDAAHHGWIGWEDNFSAAAELFASTVQGTTAGFASVDGFITNTANYSALSEPYITVNAETKLSSWIDWNLYNDESTFATAFRSELVSLGFDSGLGMLIDTSRNGWGGSDRPTGASSASDVDTMVNESRIDRRIHKGNWCNQSGAGLGERPTASPASGIDAYVWVKPPGESDGSSELIPNDEGKGFDEMCDPAYEGNPRNQDNLSGALPNAPISGAWFSAQFQELMANAYPAL
ncbi:MAG: cellulose 1,4-beta-cellobiosidase [Dactylosporangium sp.]|nr:glycoside hydrolase family 6 protein [Dactylosporangium sp.]NNJ60259.1 cellulose 1,4-beta-cellobiosidase [Dactylosporangium sp.]